MFHKISWNFIDNESEKQIEPDNDNTYQMTGSKVLPENGNVPEPYICNYITRKLTLNCYPSSYAMMHNPVEKDGQVGLSLTDLSDEPSLVAQHALNLPET